MCPKSIHDPIFGLANILYVTDFAGYAVYYIVLLACDSVFGRKYLACGVTPNEASMLNQRTISAVFGITIPFEEVEFLFYF